MMTAPAMVKPAYANFPAWTETLGPEVADLCEMAGYVPDPEQRLALDALFALGPDGFHPAMFEFCAICARQNLKTGALKMAALGWIYVVEVETITWSAHEMDTTREAFRDLVNLIENCPPLAARLADGPTNGIHRGNGNEMIEFAPSQACPNGQRIKFKARTSSGGRGLTGDKVILDEAFALKDDHIGSLMPTLSTRPEAQIVYGSSACRPESDVLRRIVARGRSTDPAQRKRLGYLEFCAPEGACEDDDCPHYVGYPGCAMDKREYIQMANPAAGRRITWQYLEDERASMSPAEFGRERLGWHDQPAVEDGPLITRDMWDALADAESAPTDPVAFGVYVNKMQTAAAIGVAGYREDGLIHVGIVPAVRDRPELHTLPGTGWIPERTKELAEAWKPCATVIDGYSSAASQQTAIEEKGVEVVTTSASDMAKACNNFYAFVRDGKLRHQGGQLLATSVTAGKPRDLADSWAWDRRDKNSDITQLVAVTLALHGLLEHGRPARSKYEDSELFFV
ncbi:terminase [Mycobacterium phage Jamie19]|uniref:Terminase large subunit n=7 Tax=Charlievirus TaxID=1623280 RepID=A0A481VYQ2_9CAUD|nr:terminase [Mycobacterium phage Rebel]YP_010052345.1 terminase [Mycobacterium phage Jamie19]QBI98079.1 terminase large subunit [Mycobacterium phage SpongeBob]QBI99132.1 terminase large subunit [Mycobacterium phage Nenae]QKY78884.1 terminase [Mycobacterium phage Rebel]QKY79006.1 terminase [Mycobacterium phage Jamie19]